MNELSPAKQAQITAAIGEGSSSPSIVRQGRCPSAGPSGGAGKVLVGRVFGGHFAFEKEVVGVVLRFERQLCIHVVDPLPVGDLPFATTTLESIQITRGQQAVLATPFGLTEMSARRLDSGNVALD